MSPFHIFWSTLVCFLLFDVSVSIAQSAESSSDIREIGIRFSGFDDFNVIYRKQVKPGVMNRHRFALLSLRINRDSESAVLDAGYSLGREFYKGISEKTNFYHGPEGSLLFNYSEVKQNSNTISSLRTTFELGYILGMQYVVNSSFRVGMEIIPVLSVYHNNNQGDRSISAFSFNFNSNFTLLTLSYRFAKKEK